MRFLDETVPHLTHGRHRWRLERTLNLIANETGNLGASGFSVGINRAHRSESRLPS